MVKNNILHNVRLVVTFFVMFLTVVFLAGLACQFLPGTSACRVSRRFCSMTTPRCTGAAVVNQVKNRINGLRKNDGSKLFRLDNKFLCRLAWVESKYGEDPNTFRRGYYGGIWQVDRNGHEETITRPYLKSYWDEIKNQVGIDWPNTRWEDLLKPLYSGLAARLYLVRIPDAIPRDLPSQARYWKTHYNTAAGAGTEQTFINEVNSAPGCAR